MPWGEAGRERKRRRVEAEINRLEKELAQLRLEAEVMAEAGQWMVLGDELEERSEGEEWLRHKTSLEAAMVKLEIRLLELRTSL